VKFYLEADGPTLRAIGGFSGGELLLNDPRRGAGGQRLRGFVDWLIAYGYSFTYARLKALQKEGDCVEVIVLSASCSCSHTANHLMIGAVAERGLSSAGRWQQATNTQRPPPSCWIVTHIDWHFPNGLIVFVFDCRNDCGIGYDRSHQPGGTSRRDGATHVQNQWIAHQEVPVGN